MNTPYRSALSLFLVVASACSDAGPNVPEPPPAGGSDASAPSEDDASTPDASTPDSAHVKKCVGSATSCALLLDSECTHAAGCSSQGSCQGYARSCSSKYSSCGLQLGCRYPSGSGACEGSAWPCSAFSASGECAAQEGCSWKQACGGVAHACSTLSATTCASQPGCRLE